MCEDPPSSVSESVATANTLGADPAAHSTRFYFCLGGGGVSPFEPSHGSLKIASRTVTIHFNLST